MSTKNVELIVAPPAPHYVGDGFRVHNFIPSTYRLDMYRSNPFIMLDYNSKYNFPPSDKPRGVGVHPHRGFETVTIVYKGSVAHGDSSGNKGVIHEGDVQWMTAASGVLHKEYHEENFSKEGGVFQVVQLWVNLPSRYKMTDPKYQEIRRENITRVLLDNNAGTVAVIAGEYKGQQGAASTFTPVHLMNAALRKGGRADFSFPESYTTALLVIEGAIRINGNEEVETDNFAMMKNDGTDFFIEASEDAIVLLLSGEPINEPVAAHGPFVMNSHQEIVQAFQDFNMGRFGYLEDEYGS